MPFGFTFEQWQPLTIASILLRSLRVRPICLSALEHCSEKEAIWVCIHAIDIACHESRYLSGFKRMRLLLKKLPELVFLPWFDAQTSDRSVHVRLLSFKTPA